MDQHARSIRPYRSLVLQYRRNIGNIWYIYTYGNMDLSSRSCGNMDMSILKVSQGPILLCLSAVALSKGTIISQTFLHWQLSLLCGEGLTNVPGTAGLGWSSAATTGATGKTNDAWFGKKHSLKLTAGTHRKSFSKRISKKCIFEP